MTNEQILKKADILKIQGITNKEYDAIHAWMRYNFGRQPNCEKCGKEGSKKNHWNIDWALVRGKTYERKRENYIGLCKSCHQSYDNPMPEWCENEKCDKPHYSKGMCQKHYNRQYFRENKAVGKWIHAYD